MNPLKKLINERRSDLGITRGTMAKRLGYTNISKALRRLEVLCDMAVAPPYLLERLPDALEINSLTVQAAVRARKEQLRLAHEEAVADELAAWRAAFRPHAIVLTERRIPSPISICAFAGGGRFVWISLDDSRPRATFIRQAIRELARRQEKWGRPGIPFYGAPLGFIVNLTPDRAIRYDLDGSAVELLQEAYRPGSVSISVRDKRLAALPLLTW